MILSCSSIHDRFRSWFPWFPATGDERAIFNEGNGWMLTIVPGLGQPLRTEFTEPLLDENALFFFDLPLVVGGDCHGDPDGATARFVARFSESLGRALAPLTRYDVSHEG